MLLPDRSTGCLRVLLFHKQLKLIFGVNVREVCLRVLLFHKQLKHERRDKDLAASLRGLLFHKQLKLSFP